MHNHTCRHCRQEFVCDESLDCFAGQITCSDCFWRYDFRHWLFFCFVGALAIVLTVALFRLSNSNGG